MAIYRVTATALNLRSAPSKTASKVAVLSSGEQVARLDDPTPTAGWVRVSWRGQAGYAAELYLAPVDAIVLASPPPAGPAPHAAAPTAAPPTDRRDVDTAKLHPVVREALAKMLAELNANGAPFRIFEAFRTPERQQWLFAQGRTRPGAIVTKAKAWQSYHQYGLAADLVLFRNNGWTWSDQGPDAKLWKMMHEAAKAHGLRPLSFELPHVEFAGPDWTDLQAGRNFPDHGDETWLDAVTGAAVRWRAAGGSPAAPPLQPAERPEMPA